MNNCVCNIADFLYSTVYTCYLYTALSYTYILYDILTCVRELIFRKLKSCNSWKHFLLYISYSRTIIISYLILCAATSGHSVFVVLKFDGILEHVAQVQRKKVLLKINFKSRLLSI